MTSNTYMETDKWKIKGDKLRKVIKETGFTQAQFAKKMGLKLNTLKYYLYDKSQGLSDKIVDDVVRTLSELGHPITKEKLLYDLETPENDFPYSDIINEIQDELSFFYQKYLHAVSYTFIEDARMEPVIPKGSIVTGLRIDKKDLVSYYSRAVIVGTVNSGTHVGILSAGKEADTIQLTYINDDYKGEATVVPLGKILFIAPICWFRATNRILVKR